MKARRVASKLSGCSITPWQTQPSRQPSSSEHGPFSVEWSLPEQLHVNVSSARKPSAAPAQRNGHKRIPGRMSRTTRRCNVVLQLLWHYTLQTRFRQCGRGNSSIIRPISGGVVVSGRCRSPRKHTSSLASFTYGPLAVHQQESIDGDLAFPKLPNGVEIGKVCLEERPLSSQQRQEWKLPFAVSR